MTPKLTYEIRHTITIELTLGEAAALEAIVGYGSDAFLKVFYERLGRAYLEPYEAHCRKLFGQLRDLSRLIKQAKEINEKAAPNA